MSKNYLIKTFDAKGNAVKIQVQSGKLNAEKIQALHGVRYELVDEQTGFAPENIRARRVGNSLELFFEGDRQPSVLIENYYVTDSTTQSQIVGNAENGSLYEYIPETAKVQETTGLLQETTTPSGMALGGDALAPAGAALAAIPVAAAGIGPLGWAGLGLLGAAAAGGGGGGGSSSGGGTTPSDTNLALKPTIKKLENDSGTSASDFITNDTSPTLSGTLGGALDTSKGDTFKLQIFKKDGTLVAQYGTEILASDKNSWTSTESGLNLTDGFYSAKAVVTTADGQIKALGEHNFIVDTEVDANININLNTNTILNGNAEIIATEAVSYEITIDPTNNTNLSKGDYVGSKIEIPIENPGADFDVGTFKVTLTDAAGNTKLTNDVLLTAQPELESTTPSYTNQFSYVTVANQNIVIESTANSPYETADVAHAGIVGKYTLVTNTSTLDLSSLVPAAGTTPIVGTIVARNLVDMSATGTQELPLKLNDVLSLGVVNAFDTNNNRAGHVQFAVNGDSADKLHISDASLWTNTNSTFSMNGNTYNVYTAHLNNMDADLFVQQGIALS
ncbi:MAG: hypothetical protein RLZ63_2055 [Pseudomonadota bacterium]